VCDCDCGVVIVAAILGLELRQVQRRDLDVRVGNALHVINVVAII
jgi:hypothetical protein